MGTNQATIITFKAMVKAPVEIVWKRWTTPDDIVKWNNASDDWHTLRAENDLRAGGKFFRTWKPKTAASVLILRVGMTTLK